MTPYISIVMPVRNEGACIAGTLRQLLAQDYPSNRYEILVVDGMSDDDTVQAANAVAATTAVSVKVLANPGRLSSRARNIGVRCARGTYVLVIDGHVHIPDTGLLARSEALIHRTGARVLGRPQRLRPPGNSPLQEAIACFRESVLGHAPNSTIFSLREGWVDPGPVAIMYERTLFEEYGGFDEALDAAEDYEFNSRLARAGLRCYQSPELEVLYHPRDSLQGFFRQMQRYGLGQARMARREARSRAVGGWIPALMVAGAALLPVASVIWMPAAWLLLASAVAYALLVLACNMRYARIHPVRWLRILAVAATCHAGLGIGWWRGMLEKRT